MRQDRRRTARPALRDPHQPLGGCASDGALAGGPMKADRALLAICNEQDNQSAAHHSIDA